MTNNELQMPYALAFHSRTIQADGTVCALKEFLCNFCQFKVASANEMEQHFSTHLFSCNYCSFRCISRLDALRHKRDSHPAASDELAGYEDLDHPALVAKVSKTSRVPGFLLGNSPAAVPISMPSSKSVIKSAAYGSLVSTMSPASLVSSSAVLAMANSATKASTVASSSSVVMRSTTGKQGDSYFTYRIVHDADGKVQAYECDVCAFQSVGINEMFAHASTHSLAELTKSCNAGTRRK
jgi:hypothetical protein